MSRFDKRAGGTAVPESERTSLKAFQAEAARAHEQERQQRRAAHQQHPPSTTLAAAAAPAAKPLHKQVDELTLDDDAPIVADDDDGRTLLASDAAERSACGGRELDACTVLILMHSAQDRLLAQDQDNNSQTSVAALLAHHLKLRKGELVVHLDPQTNLRSRSLSALFDEQEARGPSRNGDGSHEEAVDVRLPRDQARNLVATVTAAAESINAKASVLHDPFDDEGKLKDNEGSPGTETASSANDAATRERWRGRTLRLLVRKVPESAEEINEVRVCVVGNVDAGKSSLLGVLTKGRLDDGRGRARVALFRHKHEIESGRTSSVGLEVLGFGPDGREVVPEAHGSMAERRVESSFCVRLRLISFLNIALNSTASRKQQVSWEAISAQSSKVLSFTDLAGHERYLKTTLFGLTSSSPDFILLIIGGNAGLIGMSKEHLSVALALSVPVVAVVTKVDMTPPNVLEQTLKQLNKILRSPGCRKQPVYVKDSGMACELAAGFAAAKACPIFLVSNVTGEGLTLLRTFLNVARSVADAEFPVDAPFECPITDCFSVPFVGTVVSGVIMGGRVSVGDTILLGPDSLGAFLPTAVKSIQRKRVNVEHAEAGQSVSFALKRTKRAAVRKGMVLLAKPEVGPGPVATRRFEGTVLILYHNSLISPHYQAMLHSGPIRQTVQIESLRDKPCVRTGDRASAIFRFLKHGEFLRPGDNFILREGRTKVLGVVTKLLSPSKTAGE
ncbi:hypothetical protein OIV83_000914 [Microbotryomycetes sp. JL201]|nr:hypothetical protein OIV83_000914 [Microbotryomycetes sp. JL201]